MSWLCSGTELRGTPLGWDVVAAIRGRTLALG